MWKAVPRKVIVKLVLHTPLEIEACFFGEVSIVHRQEAIIIYWKFIFKRVAKSIDLFLLSIQHYKLACVKYLEIHILTIEHLETEGISLEPLAIKRGIQQNLYVFY